MMKRWMKWRGVLCVGIWLASSPGWTQEVRRVTQEPADENSPSIQSERVAPTEEQTELIPAAVQTGIVDESPVSAAVVNPEEGQQVTVQPVVMPARAVQPQPTIVAGSSPSGQPQPALTPVAPSASMGGRKPLIVDHFACSDYCPGPRERYLVKVYDGVTDKQTCLALGGEPFTYSGWGEHHICVAKTPHVEVVAPQASTDRSRP